MNQSYLLHFVCIGTLSMGLAACSDSDNKSAKNTTVADSTLAVTSTATSVSSAASPTSPTLNGATSATTATTPSAIATNAVAIDPKTFVGHETAGAMAVAMSSFMVQNLTTVSDLATLPADKKSCLLNSNHATALATLDKYLSKRLTADELKKANAFYASDLGQKLIVASDQKIKRQAGLTFANAVTLSEDDTARLKTFSATPEGKKLVTLFAPTNQLEMQRDVIEPMMKNEFDKCEVKLAGVN